MDNNTKQTYLNCMVIIVCNFIAHLKITGKKKNTKKSAKAALSTIAINTYLLLIKF